MRKMKDSGVQWIGKIPEHWNTHPIYCYFSEHKNKNSLGLENNLLSLSYGKIVRKNINSNDGLLPESFNTYNIIEKDDIIIRPTDLQNDKRSLRTAIAKERGIITSAYIAMKAIKTVNSEYFHYLLHTYDIMKVFYNMGNGVRQGLNFKEFSELMVFEPPIEEQQTIADYLDEKCGYIDNIISGLKKQTKILDDYKKSLITETVTRGLDPHVKMKHSGVEWGGEVPEHWKLIKAKYIFKQRSTKGNNIELQLLSPTQKFGVIPQELYERLTKNNAVKVNEKTDLMTFKTIHKGDYCISLRSFQGGFEYCFYEGVVSPAYTVFYSDININNIYFKYLFKEQSFINKINSFTLSLRDGKNILFSDFGNIFIPVPPIDEQQAIADYLDEKCTEIDKIVSGKKQQIKAIEDYKKSLIYEVVTGKKEV